MAHIGEIVNKEKLDNYISVLLGLRFMVNGLQNFVKSRLDLKKLEIQQKCTTGFCQLNCSRKFGKSFIKWCETCKYWKSELQPLNSRTARTRKEYLFKRIRTISKNPEINCTESGKDALHCIEILRLSNGLPERFLQQPEGRLVLFDVLNELHNDEMDQANITVSDRTLEKRLQEITRILNKRRRYTLYLGMSPKTMKLIVRQLVFFICMTYWYFTNLSSKERTEGCLSMRFKDDWNLDSFVDFNFYVENLHNQSIVSRRWLISKILEELATSEKGIILTAKMGYGKSSIVSNIVCAEHTSDWYAIRKHVLAYHFCRYDSIRSKNPAYLIRNIASAIVNRYPELGNLILSDDIAHGILYGLRCEIDPISCLEIAILNPLRNKWKNYQFVIVIDA
ncbi:Hypothetical predicted protein [Mytilus galloprovincialis]|uniref:Nephrocystin 3-like N-terminal domain-containing protein n=1 Tax=Mytilus galloprovincialis TaxID=29158 RepID=A0A8B6FD80_MYTGA|nr:Hypothetical predicted protein [Mytilus galloprovincialis]